MPFIELILIALGLSMDAFAVSVSNGLSMKNIYTRKVIMIAAAFGISQGLMPLIGYLLGSRFTEIIMKYDQYIALVFLCFIGGKMIYDGIGTIRNPEETSKKGELKLSGLILQSIATSIDALIIGISFVAMELDWGGVVFGVTVIGVITFSLCIIGVLFGKKFGELLGSKAVIFGGLILIGIGIKIFFS